MKMFKIILCFFIILFFVSCGNQEFYNISSFIDKYNNISSYSIDISDFHLTSPDSPQYTAVLGSYSNEILLSLKSNNANDIEEINLSLIKESAKNIPQEQVDFFISSIIYTLMTYCNFEYSNACEIIESFNLTNFNTLQKEGELTLKKGNFYFIYYSTNLICQFKVYNTYLKQIETTEKPVSKPYYAEDFIIKDKETP